MSALAIMLAVVVAAAPWRRRPGATSRPGLKEGRVGWPSRRRRMLLGSVAAAFVLVVAAVSPVLGGVTVIVLALRPARRRRRGRRRRAYDIADALPDLVDLLRVAVAGGATPAASLHLIMSGAPAIARPGLDAVDERLRRGARFAEAVTALADHLGPRSRPLVDALADSDRAGVALGPALDLVSADARRDRGLQADLIAKRLPVRLCFPLVVCMLPAFVLLTVAPLLAGTVRALRF